MRDRITVRPAGSKEIACLMNFGAPEAEAVERAMRLFAERVMPHVGML
jgi:hypothetical protein